MIFQTNTPTPAENIANNLTRNMEMSLRQRIMFRQQSWRSVWENTLATPDEILAALGTNAVKVLTASTIDAEWFVSLAAAMGISVNTIIDPKFLAIKAGWTLTPNNDGTVTAEFVENE